MAEEEFGFMCGSFGGVKTSEDGYIIPIAKTKPFRPDMIHGGPPAQGARYRLRIREGSDRISGMVEVTALWVTNHKSGETWLALKAGEDWNEVAATIHAFAGKAISLGFERLA